MILYIMAFIKNLAPVRGDIIRVKRKLGYYHFGIYVGDHNVIHFAAKRDDLSLNTEDVEIRLADLDVFLKGDELEVNYPNDSVFTREEVVWRAESCLGNKRFFEEKSGYNLVLNNCEHFARYCYYDECISKQVENVKKTLKTIAELGLNKLFGNKKD